MTGDTEPRHPEAALIDRVLDRTDGPEDWDALERLAARDPAVWSQLAEALREEADVRAAVAPSLACAERVDLPAAPFRPPRRSLAPWAGWAAAAILAVLWWSGRTPTPADADPGDRLPELTTSPEPAPPRAHDLGELPPMLVRARPLPQGGGLRVVYVRRILEADVYDDVYRLARNLRGDAEVVPVDPARYSPPTDF